MPHFWTDAYIGGDKVTDICPLDDNCDHVESTNLQPWIVVFIIAQMLHGIGSTPLYTIGFSFLEDSTKSDDGALYFAVVLMGSCFGPAIGFIGGALQLTLWVEGDANKPPGIEDTDPGWVGAWWIGFIACGVGAILCSLPMFGFPKQFPGTAAIKQEKAEEKVEVEHIPFSTGLKMLLTNPVFLFASFGSAMDGYLSSGLMTFGPKILEERFHKTSGAAAFQSGLVAVPGAVLGSFAGGLIAKCFKLGGKGMMWLSTGSAILTIIFYAISLQITCGNKDIVGITEDYTTFNFNLENTCNDGCNCTTELFEPVCLDERTYFSPCYAGCREIVNSTTFSDCSCNGGEATLGACVDEAAEECDKKSYVFLFVVFLVIFFEFLPPTVVPIATMRAVNPNLKSLSMGLQWNILRVFGSIPGPIALGAMLDGACVVWQNTCGEEGACWVYDDNKIYKAVFIIREFTMSSDTYFISAFATKIINICCFGSGAFFFKAAENAIEDEPEKGDKDVKDIEFDEL